MENKTRDENGNVIINMTVRDDSDFLSRFSARNEAAISSEVAEFIEGSTEAILPKEKLCLHIFSRCIDEEEKKQYESGIHNHFSARLVSSKREYNRNLVIAFILAFVGIALIALSITVGAFGSVIWMEAIDIAAWVFCWEAVDVFFFKNRALKLSSLRYSALSAMKIEFFEI